MNLTDRIREAKAEKNYSNCFGTALYLAGAVDKEEYLWGFDAEDILEEMEQVEKPVLNGLMVFKYTILQHMAIITQVDPLIVMDREGENGYFRESVPFEKIWKTYGGGETKISYYKPKFIL